MKQKNDLMTSLRAAADANGGRPPGEIQFFRQSGLTRKNLWAAGYDTYGAACEAAVALQGAKGKRLTYKGSDRKEAFA